MTGGPFPDRLHVNELVFKFVWDQTETLIGWATWAEQQVAGWPQHIARQQGTGAGAVLRESAAAGQIPVEHANASARPYADRSAASAGSSPCPRQASNLEPSD